MHSSDHYFRLQQAAFECATLAFIRRDEAAHDRARKLHRKYSHLWEQATAREMKSARSSTTGDAK